MLKDYYNSVLLFNLCFLLTESIVFKYLIVLQMVHGKLGTQIIANGTFFWHFLLCILLRVYGRAIEKFDMGTVA